MPQAPWCSTKCRKYLQEEIAAEALIRALPAFARFLEIAALGDTECLSFTSIARDCGVSAPTVKAYYQILEDTLPGSCVPAFRLRPKRRVAGILFASVGRRGDLTQ